MTPKSVTVAHSKGTLVITVHGALSPAEQALGKTAGGAAQLREFHRELFDTSSGSLRKEIKRITGVEVREATADVEPGTGSVVAVFTSGTVVQVYLLAGEISEASWNGMGQEVGT